MLINLHRISPTVSLFSRAYSSMYYERVPCDIQTHEINLTSTALCSLLDHGEQRRETAPEKKRDKQNVVRAGCKINIAHILPII